jgi:1,4-alpha-glucan branching enzyme
MDHYDPHAYLGLHPLPNGKVLRLFRPGAQEVYIEYRGERIPLKKTSSPGIFELPVAADTNLYDYRVFHQNGLLAHDPYAFWPTIGEVDLYLFGKGVHYQAYHILGAHRLFHQNVWGVRWAVWAPSARSVSVVGDFNYWDGRANPMRSLGQSGIWEIFVPGMELGEKYKFEIKTQNDQVLVKADPYGFQMEQRPKTASIVAAVDRFGWSDREWMDKRREGLGKMRPINIYEVHAGSWRRPYGRILNYRELALELATYCIDMGYTHVEFMPIQEHPLDESWGYQVSGFYAVTSRFGTPEDFQWLVNHLHSQGIGVILDWVPGHFPTDAFSLSRFDGTALYEHEDPRQGLHPHWSTHIFNFGRREVANFLIANALFFFDKMHVDGLRVDAVASILYLDYGRNSGEWIPNIYGGKENLEAIAFLKHLQSIVHEKFPGVLMIAEESTAFPGVTCPVGYGGLGFDMKWNMGWMNDTLRYFSKDPLFRRYHHHDLTFGLLYAFSERFTLPLSHDEVVHGKGSLLGKMPGDLWQKFANLRLLLSYQMCQPGKKLLFMGGEIGQWNEWYCKTELDWGLLHFPAHQGVQTMCRELNHLYKDRPALWERDFDHTGFSWVDFSDIDNSVIAYLRKSSEGELLCVHHFTPNYLPHYFLKLPNIHSIKEVFNSDSEKYGGSGKINPQADIHHDGISFQLSPLATLIFEVQFK